MKERYGEVGGCGVKNREETLFELLKNERDDDDDGSEIRIR